MFRHEKTDSFFGCSSAINHSADFSSTQYRNAVTEFKYYIKIFNYYIINSTKNLKEALQLFSAAKDSQVIVLASLEKEDVIVYIIMKKIIVRHLFYKQII